MLDGFIASHAGSWAFVVLLFILSFFMIRVKFLPMILRLFYVIMLVTGVYILIQYAFPINYLIKGILAVITIGLMEATLGRKKRGENANVFFVISLALLVVIILLGYGVIG
ncbi:DUF1516 family protein [Bacillaceae bacterium SIJ1]|uniref:DUF1516 family protein n=1 Tax=Litoribacterium kuwaitense TaxID=1398745 RepID=UPI0013E9D800|nr:DUF1516 family protein [Litoribacterium kuwaitense]NGP45882.1 DUF1516 family protein [Litoribacterium kuwaitense]